MQAKFVHAGLYILLLIVIGGLLWQNTQQRQAKQQADRLLRKALPLIYIKNEELIRKFQQVDNERALTPADSKALNALLRGEQTLWATQQSKLNALVEADSVVLLYKAAEEALKRQQRLYRIGSRTAIEQVHYDYRYITAFLSHPPLYHVGDTAYAVYSFQMSAYVHPGLWQVAAHSPELVEVKPNQFRCAIPTGPLLRLGQNRRHYRKLIWFAVRNKYTQIQDTLKNVVEFDVVR